MKTKILFCGLLAGLVFAACSEDVNNEVTQEVLQGNRAYMAIEISNTGSLSRGQLGNFETGAVSEHEVADKNAHFYFYDANGVFMVQSSVWDGGTSATPGLNQNIEFESSTIVVLTGLRKNNYPKYMVTVLNKPENFTPGGTLDEMKSQLSGGLGNGIYYKDSKGDYYFTMSTTSYKRTGTEPYYVTELETTNFSASPIKKEDITPDADGKTKITPVVVYVERLAAKVEVELAKAVTDGATKLSDETMLYPVQVSVGGESNTGSGVTGEVQVGAQTLYVRLDGWKLNAVAKASNIVKNINTSWTDATLFNNWNDVTNFRSYWGMSYNYDKNDKGTFTNLYPESSAELDAEGYHQYLEYENLQNSNKLDVPLYCPENTNTSAIVSGNFPNAVTSAIIGATICDKDGKAVGDMVRCYGIMFQKTDFVEYALATLKAQGLLNMYKETAAGKYTQITTADVEVVNVVDGQVKLALTTDAAKLTWYADDKATATTLEAIDKVFSEFAVASASNGYKGGLMYYNIPIEHVVTATSGTSIPEAAYGVVRNHWYKISINSLLKLGKGIYDPDEFIVPSLEEQDYYIGAKINILSWKIVNSGADL